MVEGVEPPLVTLPLENGQASAVSPLIPKQGWDLLQKDWTSPCRSSAGHFMATLFLVMPCVS